MDQTGVTKPIIEIKNLSVTYFPGRKHEVRALRDVSLKIYRGEFVIFFGPSGCGKSTLLYSIAGLETHAHGAITIDGKNIAEMNQQEIAEYRQKKIGMVFQAFYLITSISVLNNVLLPQMAIRADVRKRHERALELLEHFGVASQKTKLPSELSGGQQQRVAISRALVNDPDIVLADEPVGNLDSKSSKDVMELISSLNTKEKKTVVLVTHDPSHLHLAHRVFYMRDGTVIDTKINQAITKEVLTEKQQAQPPVSKELELLLRAFTSISPSEAGTLLIPFKAKEIVTEALLGMTTEEVGQVEMEVRRMLSSSIEAKEDLEKLLDDSTALGGIGLDKRTAAKIAKKAYAIVHEIRELQREEARGIERRVSDEVRSIRSHLLEAFDLSLHGELALQRFDNVVTERLKDGIDKAEATKRFDLPLRQNGVGLDRRTAQKVAQRLELLVLGKYNQ